MSNYNLNEGVDDSFEFELGGFVYNFRYPTTEEAENSPKPEADNKEQLAYLYKFITAQDESAPAIADAMGKANVRVAANFIDMVKTEFKPEA